MRAMSDLRIRQRSHGLGPRVNMDLISNKKYLCRRRTVIDHECLNNEEILLYFPLVPKLILSTINQTVRNFRFIQ